MKKISTIFAFSCAALLGAATPDFSASFDQDGSIVDEKGTATAGKYSQGEPELVEGRTGKALRVGANADKTKGYNLIYPGTVVNPSAGTITMRVKMADWDVRDDVYHILFRARGKNDDLIIYKIPGHNIRFALSCKGADGKANDLCVDDNAGNWKRGQWQFVAVTWEQGKATLYLDDRKPVSRELKKVPEKFDTCGVGGLYPTLWKGGSPGTTHIDDVKIFKRVLSADEIKEIYSAK